MFKSQDTIVEPLNTMHKTPKELARYTSDKIYMLENEFYLHLSDDDILHFRSLTTEDAVDRYAHKLFKERL